jgi:hypothetical protein
MRKRVEELFGEAKEFMGLRRMKFRGALFVREQVLLTATAQNIKRMVRLLSRKGPKTGFGVSIKELNQLFETFRHFIRPVYYLVRTSGWLCFSTS